MSKSRERCRDCNFWDMDDGGNYFFKVMMGDFQSQMTIPDKFARRFRDRVQEKIKLKVCNGSTFTVIVSRYPNKLVIEAGWETFVNIHDIRLGDFLVFRYDGNNQFEVLIFDLSCCVKASSNVAGNFCDRVQQRHRDLTEITSNSDDDQPIQLQRDQWPTQFHKKGSKKCIKKMNSSSTIHLSVSESADISFSEGYQDIPSYLFSPLAYLSKMQRIKVEKKVQAIRSDIPIFGAVMTKSNITQHPCYLGIFRQYAHQYLTCEGQIVRLKRNGNEWQAHLRFNKRNAPELSRGWKKFVSDNKLQIGDICLFELLKNKERMTMIVHIVRK